MSWMAIFSPPQTTRRPKRLRPSKEKVWPAGAPPVEGTGMRHRKAGRKFGRNSAQRQALLRQLAISMILHERLTTTEAKAKSLRPVVEKLVTIARSDSEHHRSLVMSKIDHTPATTKLFEVIAPRFEVAPGGYTRISKLGVRHGDAAPMALIEFIEV